MRIVFSAVAIVSLAFSGSVNAASPWYVSGSVGGYFPDDVSRPDTFSRLNDPSSTVNGTVRATFGSGVTENAAIGYRLTPNFRVETELGYASYQNNAQYPSTNSPDFPNLDGRKFSRSSGGEVSRFMGTVNGFYDFAGLNDRFAPYIGGGLGGASSRRSVGLYTAANGSFLTASGGSSPQAIGLIEGGLTIKLNDHLAIVPAYRYIQYLRTDQGSANIAKVGIRYQF